MRVGWTIAAAGLAWMAMAGCNGAKDPVEVPTGETGTPPVVDPTTSTGAVRVTTILSLTADTAAGSGTYAAICAACHKADGTGVPPNPALTDRIPTLTDDQVVATILDGKGNMDAYAIMTNQEIADVAAYAITSFGPTM